MHDTREDVREALQTTGNSIALEGPSIVEMAEKGIISIQGNYDRTQLVEQPGLAFPDGIGQIQRLVSAAIGGTV